MNVTPQSAGSGRSRSSQTPYVGREAELHELTGALNRVLASEGQIVLLAGEPGIGKTRLAEEFSASARMRDVSVLWGRGSEWEGAPAYWPWLQVLRSLIRDVDDGVLRRWLGTSGSDVAQIFPDVRERLSDLPDLAAMEPEQARFRLFDGITTMLKRAAQDLPRLLVLDDLHWADAPSLLMLQFLASEVRDARLFVLGTYRNVQVGRQHPLARTLAELAREQATLRVMFRGLSKSDVTRFIGLMAGDEPSETLVSAVYNETEGNPFFVTELTRLLTSQGVLHRDYADGPLSSRIPESVREVVGRRLERLSETCNETLRVASVIGRDFSLPLLERIGELSTDELLDALDEATSAHLVQEETAVGRYRFSHAIVRDTLYDELSTARRVRLHGGVGSALEEIHAENLDPVLTDLARHFFQAAPQGNIDQAITYVIDAGRQANDRLAWEEAVGQFDRALQLLDLRDRPEEQRRIELLLALLDAQMRSGDARAAISTRNRAVSIIRTHGTIEQLARVATSYDLEAANYADADIASLLEEVHDKLPMDDSILRVQVLYRLAGALNGLHRPPSTIEHRAALTGAARSMAQRLDDPVALGFALSCQLEAFLEPESFENRMIAAQELDDLARANQNPKLAARVHVAHAWIALELGDVAGSRAAWRMRSKLLDELRISAELWSVAGQVAGYAAMDGRFTDAEQLALEARTLGDRVNIIEWQPNYEYWSLLFLIRTWQGRLIELEPVVTGLLEENPDDGYWLSRAALLAGVSGRIDEARDLFDRLATDGFASTTSGPWWYVNLVPLTQVCTLLGDLPRAETLHRLLEPFAGRNINEITFCYGFADHFLGNLASLLGRREEAAQRFEAAMERNGRLESKPIAAGTQCEYASLLATSAQLTERETARTLAADTLATAKELGMAPLAARAQSLLDALTSNSASGRQPSEIVLPFGLSPRELDVLGLIVEGKTDRQIAAALFISHRTVMRHVTGILNKTGVSSRTAAATLAVREGIV